MTWDEMTEIARGNVERNLSDAVGEDYPDGVPSPDAMYDEVFTLALDALLDRGVEHELAGQVAVSLAQSYANP